MLAPTLRPAHTQPPGQFNDGAIQELRPVLPHSRTAPPLGALFYWAHAWTPGPESTIPEHPHRGFEIVSVVLQGGLHHYDSLHRQWLPLPAGGVQVIQSGSGLSHAERVGAHTRMFQIWLDPNLAETLAEAPAYTDYAPHAFSPQAHAPGLALTPVAGLGGPVALRTPGAVLYHATAHQAGTYTLPAQPGSCAVAFVQEGAAAIEGVLAQPFDAVAVPQLSLPGGGLRLETQGPARLFVVQTPARPAYRTYHERALGGE